MYTDDLEGRTRVSGGPEEENVNFDPSKAHVDPKALPTIMDVVRRLQESEGLLIGQTAPFDKVCSSYLAPLTGDPFQADADSKAVQQAREMRNVLLAAKEALYTILRCISVQANTLDTISLLALSVAGSSHYPTRFYPSS